MKPAASGALAPRADKSARLHPKCFTTGRKNTPLAFTGPQIRSIVVNRIATIAQGRIFGSVMLYLPPASGAACTSHCGDEDRGWESSFRAHQVCRNEQLRRVDLDAASEDFRIEASAGDGGMLRRSLRRQP